MTTRLIIQNDATSNGDVVVRYANTCSVTGGGAGAESARKNQGNTLRLMPAAPGGSEH